MSDEWVPAVRAERVHASTKPISQDGAYVLYWMIAARRTSWSHALQHAVRWAQRLGKPLLVLEALRVGSAWSSRRVHRFVVQGMATNARRFAQKGVTYHPYLESVDGHGSGLVSALARDACVVVTDHFPTHFLPRMVAKTAERLPVRVDAVDGFGVIPVDLPDRDFTVAHSFRRWVQRTLPTTWDPPVADPLCVGLGGAVVPDQVRSRWPALGGGEPDGTEALPEALDGTPGELEIVGGERAARARWHQFLEGRLEAYHEDRSHPDADVQTGLSPWLHFGQISSHELIGDLAPEWCDGRERAVTGKRTGWWDVSEPAEALLDQLVTWRELGAVQAHRDLEAFTSYAGLPEWARRTLDEHRSDVRREVYSLDQLDAARTSDPLWNAAQRQLRREGMIHNALRMLWGKKVLGWTEEPEEAFERLVHLNNHYAIDGRDPNSYSGIGWVFGRFDRAWGPERPVFGKVRYMTSESSQRKWRLKDYLRRYA